MDVADKEIVSPAQYAPVLDALAIGFAITVTSVLAFAVHPLAFVTTTVYVPPFAGVAFAISGFCTFDVNPLGPFQANEVASAETNDNTIVWSAQYPPVLDAVTVGEAFTTTTVVASAVQEFALETTSVYVPAFASVAFAMVGFCKVDENPLGPLHA